ncbi:hypothetical protein EWM62_00150 [Mucilaginibacter terrigena]|uniref:Uncharacterized protein n=1 Tax=Mucilaginibacter terrigena TaxID=2492395 RepID=A0A4Q5LQX3_9SPHI|nr:hypothetical protein [Mucilaginibacter terrigena]RYU91891.1 hypothetical protein EWM62_00150 [Mucilaginibacter terrigena]
MMKKIFCLTMLVMLATTVFAQQPKFKVLAFYTTTVESDHVDFANDAIKHFTALAAKKALCLIPPPIGTSLMMNT